MALICASTCIFTQKAEAQSTTLQEPEELAKLRNDGISALDAKDYQGAFTNFSAYLEKAANQDSVIAYNCGLAADKIKKPAEAVKYFDIAIQKKFNLANAYIGKAGALKDLGKDADYIATLKEGMQAVPDDATLSKLYIAYYTNEGVTAQKAGKVAAAQKAYETILETEPDNSTALYNLGAMFYSQGVAKVKTSADAAKDPFTKAKTYLGKASPLLKASTNANDQKRLANADAMLKYINTVLK